MKTLALLLLSGIMAAGCTSSEKKGINKEEYESLVEIKPPDTPNPEDSQIYIDSVRLTESSTREVLLVSGNFPDGCTHLGKASHTITNGNVELSLSAWRNPDMMCTQALTPFSFIYDELPEEDLEKQSSVLVNGTTYELK